MATNLPTIDIKGNKYTLVKDRILHFNKEYPNGFIATKMVSNTTDDRVVMYATVTPDLDKPERKFRDYSQALWGDGYINKTSAIENCSTSAVGRALALMGIGVIDSVASVDEIEKANITAVQDEAKKEQDRQQTSPVAVRGFYFSLKSKGIEVREDAEAILTLLNPNWKKLNTSGIAKMQKELDALQPDTIDELLAPHE